MKNHCLIAPTKGYNAFLKFKKQIGYEKAWRINGLASNKEFISTYKETLNFDSEGFPTYESLLNNEYIQRKIIGIKKSIELKNEKFKVVEDTISNYNNLLEEALQYNRDNKEGNLVAIVEYAKNGIKINLVEKTSESLDKFKKQYAVSIINSELGNLLSPLGISPEMLTKAEVKAGRTGSTRFISAMGIVQSATALIKIANNMEGVEALSEEFCHVIVDALRDNPLIKRALNSINDGQISSQILGEKFYEIMDYYEGDLSMVAEEALGQILKEKLIEGATVRIGEEFKIAPEARVPNGTENLFNRIKNFILNTFKKLQYNSAVNTINKVNTLMYSLSEDLLSEKVKIEKINTKNRDALFNSLSERIDRNIEVLKSIVEIEIKRSKLLHEDYTAGKERIDELESYIEDRNKSAYGLMVYANKSLHMLKNIKSKLDGFDLLSFEDQVKALRTTSTVLQSFGSFVCAFTEIINSEEKETDNLFKEPLIIKRGNEEIKIDAVEILKDITHLINKITSQYSSIAMPTFVKFMKDQLGEETLNLLLKNAGKDVTIESLMKNGGLDISFFDLWLDAMRDSSNPILQAYDKIIKKANDRARFEAIELFKRIQAVRQSLEAEGITDFEFMFEKDIDGKKSGNYVHPEYNYAEYLRQRKVFEETLTKFGKDKKAIREAKSKWLKEHTILTKDMQRIPRASKFPAKKLSSKEQKAFDTIISLKKELDSKYPESRVNTYKAIQDRKDNIQRITDAGFNPSVIYKEWMENLKYTYTESADDNDKFGESSGLTNFDGTEYMRLPVLYVNRLQNPEELSTDIFGSLIAYAAATTKYEQMEKIVSPLEIGRDLIEGKTDSNSAMNVQKSNGQKRIIERIDRFGKTIKRPALMDSEPNIYKKLDIFLETQVYQRYLKDEGTFEIFGKNIKTSKVTSRLLEMGSIAQLGFNFLANIANVGTGIAMLNIEAAAGHYFKASELAKADKEYGLLIGSFIAESYARNKNSKLALFDELFDVRQDFGKNKFHSERKNILQRIFGKTIRFLGQEAGDHWLYNRIAIAMCMHIKVKYKGKDSTLWDVLEIRTKEGTDIKEMFVPEGVVDSLGNKIDKERIGAISRRIASVNHRLFGIYNEEDMNAANRISLGRILQQYRKWIKPQMNARFETKRTDLDLGEEVEGYYRTSYRHLKNVLSELKRGEFQYTIWKDNLTEMEKANIKRTITEIAQFMALSLLVMFLNGGDADRKDEIYAKKLARYCCNRLLHETGNLTPSFTMFGEIYKTVNSPAAVLGVIGDTFRFGTSLINPFEWTDELKSGDYKGHSHLYKNFMRLPVAPLSYIRQFQRATGGLDRSTSFYTNPDLK